MSHSHGCPIPGVSHPSPSPPMTPWIAHLHTPLRQLNRSEAMRPRSNSGSETSLRSCPGFTKGFHTILFILEQSGAEIESGEKVITGKQMTVDVLSSAPAGARGRRGWWCERRRSWAHLLHKETAFLTCTVSVLWLPFPSLNVREYSCILGMCEERFGIFVVFSWSVAGLI